MKTPITTDTIKDYQEKVYSAVYRILDENPIICHQSADTVARVAARATARELDEYLKD